MYLKNLEYQVSVYILNCRIIKNIFVIHLNYGLGIGFLLGSVANVKSSPIVNKHNMSLEDRLNLEIAQYESEPTPCLEECPLMWWSRMSSKCQNLIRLARKHFVYALSGSSSKLPLELQTLFYIKRSQINQELVDKMMFINANTVENN